MNTSKPVKIHRSGIVIDFQKTTVQTTKDESLPQGRGSYMQYPAFRHWHNLPSPEKNQWPKSFLKGDKRLFDLGIDITYVYVVVPESEWYVQQTNRAAPTWIYFGGSKGAALMFRWGSINPLTLNHEMPLSMAPQQCTFGNQTGMVQSIIDTSQTPWIDGFPVDPFHMHDSDAKVRQMLLTVSPTLDSYDFLTKEGPAPWAISVLAWKQKRLVTWVTHRSRTPVPNSHSTENAYIGAGATIQQRIAIARPESAFNNHPCSLARYFVIDQALAEEIGLYDRSYSSVD